MSTIKNAAYAAAQLSKTIRTAVAETGEEGGRGALSAALNALATDAAKLAFALEGVGGGMPDVTAAPTDGGK